MIVPLTLDPAVIQQQHTAVRDVDVFIYCHILKCFSYAVHVDSRVMIYQIVMPPDIAAVLVLLLICRSYTVVVV